MYGPGSVGTIPAGDSPYGVHDMAGNVAEWTRDWYGSYPAGDQIDPGGIASGIAKVQRGGSFETILGVLSGMAKVSFGSLTTRG